MCVFYFVYSTFLYFLCIFSTSVHSCFLPIFAQVYRPLPPGGNTIAINQYHIILSYRMLYIKKGKNVSFFFPSFNLSYFLRVLCSSSTNCIRNIRVTNTNPSQRCKKSKGRSRSLTHSPFGKPAGGEREREKKKAFELDIYI